MKQNKKILIGAIGFLLIGFLIGIFIATYNNSDEDGICKPTIACLDDTLVYQTLSCGLLVNTNPEEINICKDGKFLESSPLVRTAIGNEQTAVIVDTQLLDLEENKIKWKYYPKQNIPEEIIAKKEVLFSPPEEIVCIK